MCLNIRGKKFPGKARVARRPLTVYKRLCVSVSLMDGSRVYLSPIKLHEWVPGRLEKARLRVFSSRGSAGTVEDGIHAHTSVAQALRVAALRPSQVVFEATIPKGAKYYLGINGDIVSNRMVLGEPHSATWNLDKLRRFT